jgi:hypothetical protein
VEAEGLGAGGLDVGGLPVGELGVGRGAFDGGLRVGVLPREPPGECAGFGVFPLP